MCCPKLPSCQLPSKDSKVILAMHARSIKQLDSSGKQHTTLRTVMIFGYSITLASAMLSNQWLCTHACSLEAIAVLLSTSHAMGS